MFSATHYVVTLDSPEYIQAHILDGKQYYRCDDGVYSTIGATTARTQLIRKRKGLSYVEVYEQVTAAEYVARPVRQIVGIVQLFDSNFTLLDTFNHNDRLISFSIERVGDEEKFYGYSISQKLNVKLLDINREIEITAGNLLDVHFMDIDTYFAPTFKVTEVHRDENTNQLSITAYDCMYLAANHTFSELNLTPPYTIEDVACAITNVITDFSDYYIKAVPPSYQIFQLEYTTGANFEGTETLRSVIDSIAEATQTIAYVDRLNRLTFRFFDITNRAGTQIPKAQYFNLNSKTNRRLKAITATNDLGDSTTASIVQSGSTQIVWSNPFYELRDDIGTLLDNAISYVGGLTIGQFDSSWRGNYTLEIGDKITFIDKEDEPFTTFLLNDTITYDGTLSQKTSWEYKASESESPTNPTSLGETLKQTYARVDKANKEITLLTSEVSDNTSNISSLSLNTESIWAAVQEQGDNTSAALDNLSDDIDELTNTVSAKMSAEDVQIQIQTALSNGVDAVTTSTGYTFNEDGLTITKSGSEMNTQITEDGMTVYRDSSAVLVANNAGVDAVNLHASTYLIIGTNSRFEDYDNGARTGCFWIGS